MEDENTPYGEIVAEYPNTDGTWTVVRRGRYNGQDKTEKRWIRADIDTTNKTLAQDVLASLTPIKSGSPEVTIRVINDKFGNPFLIQKTWLVIKEING